MIRLLSSDAWAALTAGISTVPIEVVSYEGEDGRTYTDKEYFKRIG